MQFFPRDELEFHYRDGGRGLPFLFEHGLGSDLSQPFGLYRPAAGVRLIALDMRGHGETRPLGDAGKLTLADLAGDAIALLDHLGIGQAVVGGISLGAAVAAKVAIFYPERVLGLILSRPAWIDRPLPENVHLYATIARLIREVGPTEGLERFRASPEFLRMERDSPDCARSLVVQFEHPRAVECVARLERLAADTLCPGRAPYQKIRVPALILGNRRDPIHPWSIAEALSQLITNAELREITPKSVSPEIHAADVQEALDVFLSRFLPSPR
jgi:pimeloyl-ACP methyl ester carboxylesterase